MKIVIIANGYPDKREPQWGCFERDQAVALTGQGHQVSILYVDRRFRTYWRKIGINYRREDGIDVCGVFLFPFLKLAHLNFQFHFRIVSKMLDWAFRCLVKRTGMPDVIYAHYLYNISFATHLKEKYHIPLVGIEHWSELTRNSLIPYARFHGNIAYHKADKILAVSKSLQSKIKRHFGVDSTVVYDMLGPEFVHSGTDVRVEGTKAFRFISVGSLLPIKNYDILIRAFAKTGLSNEGCTLLIVGDGTERINLENIVRELHLKKNVCLLGRKSRNDIARLLSESHVYVLPSKAETFGVACIEALSQGLPTIATKCGGPEEFIHEHNGLLIPVDDIDALSDAMIEIYNQYSKYNRTLIKNECLSRFAPDVIAKQLTGIFEKQR
jgi:glycosyltransferase involved in cell wall biosynthesis